MKPAPIFCLECQDTGYLEPVAFGDQPEPCPHCDTGAQVIEAQLEAVDVE